MIARPPNRQNQRKLATQSYGSKTGVAGHDCQITEERRNFLTHTFGNRIYILSADHLRLRL
jgi:hypothetical protein